MVTIKVVKKGKPMRRIRCPECGAIWLEEFKKGKKFTCSSCGATLEFEKGGE